MSTNTRIILPTDVRIDDVATVIGKLAGLPAVKKDSDKSFFTSINGVKIIPSSMAEMAEIVLEGNMIDKQKKHFVYYFFEGEHGKREICPKSTAFWVAIGKRLVEFFGGKIDYNDCDNIDWDYESQIPREHNDPNDGKEWNDFQEEIYNLKPITKLELKEAQKFASYK